MSTLEERNKQTVTEFMEVFTSGDVDGILSRMTDDATWWVAGSIPGISGTKDKAAFKEMVSGIAGSTTSGAIRLTPLAFTAEGDRVAVETESYTELRNGRVYNNLYHFLFTVRDGKIAGVKEYLDTEHTTAVFVAP
ncbi:nuclear transport factor 2 family protein [Pseudonocardia sp. C8]|uniref:nuclear transport factor 2 family protein n=1 Tax=Pseudonocardia sp. C8 TaxID=2762759 RepID=UPI0016429C2C|nr:nuclear transport factor 2 family protein [Pseudonocardia sp. C8]MBC3192759.1 nuclear transport factor 2 family protein [Pseudonocardia sp. C8]